MFICHPENEPDKLDNISAHSEGLRSRIYRLQPGQSCQFPEMLSVPGEVIYRGDAPFLLNVNHKGVQFFGTFSQVYNDEYTMISDGILEDFSTLMFFPYSGCLIHKVTIYMHFSF